MANTHSHRGDTGTTTHPFSGRVSKSDDAIETVGLFDEAQVAIGYAIGACKSRETQEVRTDLLRCLDDLFACGAHAFTSDEIDTETTWLDSRISELNAELPPLHSFIKPIGNEPSGRLHLARVAVRRLERQLWRNSSENDSVTTPERSLDRTTGADAPPYASFINRLSDYLFAAARYANR